MKELSTFDEAFQSVLVEKGDGRKKFML